MNSGRLSLDKEKTHPLFGKSVDWWYEQVRFDTLSLYLQNVWRNDILRLVKPGEK